MAKKHPKKIPHRTSKTKRSPTPHRKRLPKSLTAAEIMARADMYAQKIQAQEERRQLKVERNPTDYELPVEVQKFLDALYNEPNLLPPNGSCVRTDTVRMWRILQALRDAYRQGCRQGYVEGRLTEVVAKDRRLIGKMAKERAKLVSYDGVKIPMDERDAKIFFELPAMRRSAETATAGDDAMGERACLDGRQVRNIFFEQTVLREYVALIQQGLGEAGAAERVVHKHGVDKHGKPRHKKVRDILAKAPQRTLPEVE
jgi:hypothetical protein